MDIKLPLDIDEPHPRRLLSVPGAGGGGGEHPSTLLAWGGDDGTLWAIADNTPPRLIRRYDSEAVRSVCFNRTGTRVAVAFDTGIVQVYCYNDYQSGNSKAHPFVQPPSQQERDHPDLSQNMLLSQQSDNNDAVAAQYPGETVWMGPTLDAPCRHVVFHPIHEHVLVVASECGLCVVNTSAKERVNQRHLEQASSQAHNAGGVGSVCFGNVHDGGAGRLMLATLGMDGKVCVWDASSNWNDHDDGTISIAWKLLDRDSMACVSRVDIGELLGSSALDRSSAMLFVGQVLLLPGEPFLQVRTLDAAASMKLCNADIVTDDDDDNNNVPGHLEGILCFAHHHNVLVTAGRDGRVVQWHLDVATPTPQARLVRMMAQHENANENAVTDLVWHNGCFYAVGATGRLQTLDVPVPQAESTQQQNVFTPGETAKAREAPTVSAQQSGDKDDGFNMDDASVDGPAAASAPAARTTVQPMLDGSDDESNAASPDQRRNRFVDDEADDGETEQPTQATSNQYDDMIVGGNDDDDDDIGGGANDDDDDVPEFSFTRDLGHPSSRPTMELPDPQPAFAPASTPLDLTRRYLCWNHLGSVLSYRNSTDNRRTIDVDFTDTVVHRPISFTDNMGFVIGTLGEDGGLFATDLADDEPEHDDDDDGELHGFSATTRALLKKSQQRKSSGAATGSTLYFHRFATFGSVRDKDWHVTLPDGERVLGCAAGEGWAAAMTSRRFVRLFTSGGNQGQVLWLNGEPVTMAGRGRLLAVTYHEAAPLLNGTQKLGYMLYDAVARRLICKGVMSCITSGSLLTWLGFSNDQSLLAMDSDGMLSMLVCTDPAAVANALWEWMPVLDTVGLRKSNDDLFWPITIYDGKLVCIPLKGGTQHPDATRRPVTATLGLRLPLARGGGVAQANALEELAVRAGIALGQKKSFQAIEHGNDTVDKDFEQEYRTLSAQVDKVTLKLFVATVEAGKLERALDLVAGLHLEKSFELAITLARGHHKLVDLIEDVRERKFVAEDESDNEDGASEEEDEAGDDYHTDSAPFTKLARITPDATGNKRMLTNAASGRQVRPKVV